MVSDNKEKNGRGHVARLRWGQVPQPPRGLSPESQLPLLQLPSGCGRNRNMGTLIRLINSLCSRVVAIRPAVWAALGTGQRSPRLLAPRLPSLCWPLALSLGRGARQGGFSGVRVPWLLFTYLLTVTYRCLLSTYYVPRRWCLPCLGWLGNSGGRGLGDEVIEVRRTWSYSVGRTRAFP